MDGDKVEAIANELIIKVPYGKYKRMEDITRNFHALVERIQNQTEEAYRSRINNLERIIEQQQRKIEGLWRQNGK